MTARLLSLIGLTLVFGAISAVALFDVGYFGIFEAGLDNWGAGQVFADLVVLAILGMVWMHHDSRSSGINPWPFIVITLAAGSFGVLFYLIARELRAPARDRISG